jgi:glycosyltransferase involved in cell wall biosynthesis
VVVLDIRSNQRTGINRYGTSILRALGGSQAIGVDLHVVADRVQLDYLSPSGRRYTLAVPPEPDKFVRRSNWVLHYLAERRPDLYVTTHYSLDRRIDVPFIHTVHDLSRLRFPEHGYTRESVERHYGAGEWSVMMRELSVLHEWDDGEGGAFLRYFRALNHFLANRASALMTVSQASRDDIVRLLSVDASTVHLVPGGVDSRVFRRQPPRRVRAVLDRLGVTPPYLLYVGLVGPTKRFGWLLEALLRQGLLDVRLGRRLVVVGGHADRRPDVFHLLGRHRTAGSVIFTGYVSDADLACLYTSAAALVVPSLSEGYHLGMVEALACGCEVIAADIPSLRETAGRCLHFHPVDDDAAFAYLCAEAFAGRLPKRAPDFEVPTWAESADRLLDAVRAGLTAANGLTSPCAIAPPTPRRHA